MVKNRFNKSSDRDRLIALQFTLLGRCNGYRRPKDAGRQIRPWLDNPNRGLVLAYEGDLVVGFALHRYAPESLYPGYQAALEKAGHSAEDLSRMSREVAYIGVHPDGQERGIGGRMLDIVISETERLASPQLYAQCWKGEEGPSLALFRSRGFLALHTEQRTCVDKSDLTHVVRGIRENSKFYPARAQVA